MNPLLLALQDAAAAAPAYTAAEVLGFFAAAGVLITALGGVIVNVIVALRTGRKLDDAAIKTSELSAQVAEVHHLTNSGLSAVKAELAESLALNLQLRDIIADLKSEREKDALVEALRPPSPMEALAAIDVNTAATAANTKGGP